MTAAGPIRLGVATFQQLVPVEDRMLVQTYRQSLDGFGNIRWPDGGALLDQPVKLTRAFAVIAVQLSRFEKKGP